MTLPNHDPDTGIAFSIVKANLLNSDLVHELMYVHGKDIDFEPARKEAEAVARAAWENKCEEDSIAAQENDLSSPEFDDFVFDENSFSDSYCQEEPRIAGTYEGVTYQTTHLGGALHFWIFKSPLIAKGCECSPCVPRALNLDQFGQGNYEGYGIPYDWWDDMIKVIMLKKANAMITSFALDNSFALWASDYLREV